MTVRVDAMQVLKDIAATQQSRPRCRRTLLFAPNLMEANSSIACSNDDTTLLAGAVLPHAVLAANTTRVWASRIGNGVQRSVLIVPWNRDNLLTSRP
jgi:hypothetical protein